MPRRRAEVPDPRLAVAGEQAPAGQLVSRPRAEHGPGDVADVVLVEEEQSAQPGLRERLPDAPHAVFVQTAEVDALLEVHLGVARRLDGPVPPMLRVGRVGLPRRILLRRRRGQVARHVRLLGTGWATRLSYTRPAVCDGPGT